MSDAKPEMNEEAFLKEHPSLEGKVLSDIEPIRSPASLRHWIRCVKGESKEIDELTLYDNVVHTKDIHETQLDKKKVEELIDTGKNPICTNCSNYLKKELGIE